MVRVGGGVVRYVWNRWHEALSHLVVEVCDCVGLMWRPTQLQQHTPHQKEEEIYTLVSIKSTVGRWQVGAHSTTADGWVTNQ